MTTLTDPSGVSFHEYVERFDLHRFKIRDPITKMNRLQAENHDVIVKHVRGKHSVRVALIGQVFT